MGFLKKLFGRRPGGTRVGNFIRQWAYNNSQLTDGVALLGSNIQAMSTAEKYQQINPYQSTGSAPWEQEYL